MTSSASPRTAPPPARSAPSGSSPSGRPGPWRGRRAVVGCATVLLGITGCRGSATADPTSTAGARPTVGSQDTTHALENRGRTNDRPGRPGRPVGGSAETGGETNTAPATLAARYADGHLPDGVDVFDDSYPAVTRLEAGLRRALRRAAAQASRDGIRLVVNSGWRSAAYQEQLLSEARARYGDDADSGRWVATPDTSSHVRGQAVDIGGADATAWLARHGAASGLCSTYANEPWHFELRPDAPEHGCPDEYPDASHDPRRQQ